MTLVFRVYGVCINIMNLNIQDQYSLVKKTIIYKILTVA